MKIRVNGSALLTGSTLLTVMSDTTELVEVLSNDIMSPSNDSWPNAFSGLFTMDRLAFEKLVTRALRRLPRKFKQKLENISVQIQDVPTPELLKDTGVTSGTLLGLYQGVPLTERGWGYGNVLPDRILIFQRPIEAAASPSEIEDMVLEVVMHEIGHYFGFDDEALYRIEKDKKRGKRKK